MEHQKLFSLLLLLLSANVDAAPPPHPNVCSNTACYELSPTGFAWMRSQFTPAGTPITGSERVTLVYANVGIIEIDIGKLEIEPCDSSSMVLSLGDGRYAHAEGCAGIDGSPERSRKISITYCASSKDELRWLVDSLSMLWLVEGPPERRSPGLSTVLSSGVGFKVVAEQ